MTLNKQIGLLHYIGLIRSDRLNRVKG